MDATSFGTIAASVVALLAPYLKKGGEKFSESIGSAAWEKVVALHRTVKARFAAKGAATEALADLTNSPEDTAAQEALRRQLRETMSDDEQFAKHLVEMLHEADEAGVDAIFHTNVHGSVKNLTQINEFKGRMEFH